MSARRIVKLPEPFRMRHGGVLPEVEIAYETWGTLSANEDNAILVFTGLSPGAHIASSAQDPSPGWWEEMVGPGHAIDTDRFHVICMNSLGSCHGSTGPASIDPRTGKRYGLGFPVLTVEDIASTAHAALRALGVPRLKAVVGPSLGGMTALAYAILFPDALEELVVISGAPRALPFAIAVRSLQREIIRQDPLWAGGEYSDEPVIGMRLARKLGMMSYRSAQEWKRRFGRERVDVRDEADGLFGIEFEIESYLEAHARKFAGTFDANCYLYLSRAIDIFDVAEHGGTVEAGLARVKAPRVLVIGVESDILFPLEQQEEIASTLAMGGLDVRFVALPSIQGHDSFLVDIARFGPVLREFLNG